MLKNLDKVTDIAEGVCKTLGFVLVDARVIQHGKRRSLEVTIHNPDGFIGFADCEKVSRQIEEEIDQVEPPLIDGAFLLEVQSPGLDRELKTDREFAVFSGHPVEVKINQKLDGVGDFFRATLLGVKAGTARFSNPKPVETKAKKVQKSKPMSDASSALPKNIEIELSKLSKIRLYSEVQS